jgi:hypothetical protein
MLLSTFVRDTSPHGLGVASSCNVRWVNQSQAVGSCMLIAGYWARNWEQKRLSSLRYEEGAAMFDAYQVVGDGSTAGFPAKGGVEL